MLISCLMPTRGRPAFAAEALECYRAQTYQDRELIIIDDADCPSFPTPPEGTQYHRMSRRLTIAAKLNIACSRANGDILARVDDDDWFAAERLADQIERIKGHAVTGYHSMRFTDGARWWQYTGSDDNALGTSLMFTREYWQEHPFNTEIVCGEDVHFIAPARAYKQIISVDAGDMMFARNHPGNTDQRNMTNPLQWRQTG